MIKQLLDSAFVEIWRILQIMLSFIQFANYSLPQEIRRTKPKREAKGPITIFFRVEEEAGDFVFGQVILLLLQ